MARMMTGRERVRAALTFSRPDRAPRDLWPLPFMSLFRRQELDDLRSRYPVDIARPELSPGSDDDDLRKLSVPGRYIDEWGSVWNLAEPGIIGEVKQPAVSDWSKLASFRPPWGFIRSRNWDHVNRTCDQSDTFMLSGVCARPFERLQFLRGTENLLIDLLCDTQEVRTLLDIVHEYYLEDVTNWSRSHVDGVFIMDDWGSNTSLLINPEMWRSIFRPLYKEYSDIIHRSGKSVFFHSDGNIEAIYGDLLEIGVDALNSQLFCMDIERLAREYKGRVTFWGEIDRQQVLPYGTPEDVRNAVRRVRRLLDDGNGGVIAQCEWGKDNTRQNVEAVFKAWLEPL